MKGGYMVWCLTDAANFIFIGYLSNFLSSACFDEMSTMLVEIHKHSPAGIQTRDLGEAGHTITAVGSVWPRPILPVHV